MKFSLKIFLIVGMAAAIASGTSSFIAWSEIEKQGEHDLVLKSQSVLNQLEATRNYVAAQGGLTEYIDSLIVKYPDGKFPDDIKSNVLHKVPIFASIKVGKDEAQRGGYQFRVFSPEARRKENMASQDEMTIFAQFEKDPQLQEIVDSNKDRVIVYRPVRLAEAQGCLICHGDPANSPFKNGKDILGFKMENWVDGKLHGVFALTSSMEATHAKSAASLKAIFLIGVVGLVLSIFCAWLALRKSLAKLLEAIASIKNSSSHLNSTGHEISNAATNLSSASTQAAAALEETSASLEELTSMVKLNTENAQSAKVISEGATQSAKDGERQIVELLDSMKKVAATAKKVEEITTVIDDIAFQTNLLALNASVEAARAGDHGKGFAVVADAVRSLAQKSATSAKEISSLIGESAQQVSQSYEYAVKSEQRLQAIVKESEKVAVLNAEIAHASSEQSTGLEQIGKAIHELDKVTQGNAASSEEAAAASIELSGQSEKLDLLVESVGTVVYGGKAA